MDYQEPPAREYPSHNPLRIMLYADKAPSVQYRESIKRIDDLVGQTMSLRIPVKAFQFKEGAWVAFNLTMQLRGRKITMETKEEHTEQPITAVMIH